MKTGFELRVFHAGEVAPRRVVRLANAAELVAAIPELLREHAECERVEVYAGTARLFSVDCHGNSKPG